KIAQKIPSPGEDMVRRQPPFPTRIVLTPAPCLKRLTVRGLGGGLRPPPSASKMPVSRRRALWKLYETATGWTLADRRVRRGWRHRSSGAGRPAPASHGAHRNGDGIATLCHAGPRRSG